MIVLPMRPQPPRLLKSNDSCATSSASLPIDQRLHLLSKTPSETAGAMISVMPSISPDVSKRPKLSLKTSIPSLAKEEVVESTMGLGAMADTPTYTRNYVNALDTTAPSFPKAIPQTQEPSTPILSNARPSLPSSASSSASSLSSGQTSPLSISAPYSLPLGSHSILRNSPLPRPYLSATSTRAPRRMFPPIKRVLFRELLEEIIPSQVPEVFSEASDSENSGKRPRDSLTNENGRGRRTADEEELSTPVHGRRKRRREWIWRPLEDDILVSHRMEKCPTTNDTDTKNKTTIREMIEPCESSHAGNPEPPSSESLIEITEITTRDYASPKHGPEPTVRNDHLAADQPYPCSMHETQFDSEITEIAAATQDRSSETRLDADDAIPP